MAEPRLAEDQWLAERLGKPAYHLVGGLGERPGRTGAGQLTGGRCLPM